MKHIKKPGLCADEGGTGQREYWRRAYLCAESAGAACRSTMSICCSFDPYSSVVFVFFALPGYGLFGRQISPNSFRCVCIFQRADQPLFLCCEGASVRCTRGSHAGLIVSASAVRSIWCRFGVNLEGAAKTRVWRLRYSKTGRWRESERLAVSVAALCIRRGERRYGPPAARGKAGGQASSRAGSTKRGLCAFFLWPVPTMRGGETKDRSRPSGKTKLPFPGGEVHLPRKDRIRVLRSIVQILVLVLLRISPEKPPA